MLENDFLIFAVLTVPVGDTAFQRAYIVSAAYTFVELGEDRLYFKGGPVSGKYVWRGKKILGGHMIEEAGVELGEYLFGYRPHC
jgi:hypothetical protein